MKKTLHLSIGKRGVRKDVDGEIRFHLEMRAREFMEAGMSREEARAAAEASFGDVSGIVAECRRIRRRRARQRRVFDLAHDLAQDLKFALRSLRKSPGFTAAILTSLGLGIGANTAVFSLVNGVLLRPLPYAQAADLAQLQQTAFGENGSEDSGFSPPELQDYRAHLRSFEGLVEYHSMDFTLLGLDVPRRVQTGVVSAHFFDLFGVEPLLGRTFRPGEDGAGAEPVLVLSYDFWKHAFGGNRDVVGRKLEMNDRIHTVVGVLPPLPHYPDNNDVYMPVSSCPFRSGQWAEERDATTLSIFARLKPGATLPQAQADLARVAGVMQRQHREEYSGVRELRTHVAPLKEQLVQNARPRLLILLGISGLLLLLVCANVANLSLARLMRREREMAIRVALGAGRGRLFRQLFAEGTVLSLAGGLLAVLLALATLDLLVPFVARFTSRAALISVDRNVLLFTLAVCLVSGLFLALLPVLSSRKSPMEDLKEGGSMTAASRRMRARSALIVSQVAMSFVLLVAAGLLIRSFIKLQSVDPGFRTENVLTARINLDWTNYGAERSRDFARRLMERVESLPGTRSVAVANKFPFSGQAPWDLDIRIEGELEGPAGPRADFLPVSEGYFRTIGIRRVSGRAFDRRDAAGDPIAVVINQAFSRTYFPGRNPVGQRICMQDCERWATIVGVVGDTRQYGLDSDVRPTLYLPFAVFGWRDLRLLVRTVADPIRLQDQVRQAAWSLDPDQPVIEVRTLAQARSASLASQRLTTLLMGAFAALALAITTAGLAGIIAYNVSLRTRELGIRLALGADSQSVVRMVMRQAVSLVFIGLAIGIPLALALSGLLRGWLFDTGTRDPLTFAAVAVVVVGVAATAALAPARRATGIDPVLTLRAE